MGVDVNVKSLHTYVCAYSASMSMCVYVHLYLQPPSGMLARIVSTGALYKKTLELNLKTIGELSIGKIVNLASNDVQRLDIVSQ